MDRYLRRQIIIILYLLGLIAVMIVSYYSGRYDANIKQQKMEINK